MFVRFARRIFWPFVDVLVLSTTWNDQFCKYVDDVSIWWQMFNFIFSCPKRWFQFNSGIVRTHFSSKMSLNNWKMVAETRSHIFRWRSRFRRRRVCLSSLILLTRRIEILFTRRNELQGKDGGGGSEWVALIAFSRSPILQLLTVFVEEEPPSRASSSFLFFLGPMAASAVELAARFRINSSSSCWSYEKIKQEHLKSGVWQTEVTFANCSGTFCFYT